jgi:hypothetical protein
LQRLEVACALTQRLQYRAAKGRLRLRQANLMERLALRDNEHGVEYELGRPTNLWPKENYWAAWEHAQLAIAALSTIWIVEAIAEDERVRIRARAACGWP